MKRVLIESPYAGDIERNVKYARKALLDSLGRGEAPFAMHLLYTQVLDDLLPEERKQGIAAGLAWGLKAELFAAYVDYGISPGMEQAKSLASSVGIPWEERRIYAPQG